MTLLDPTDAALSPGFVAEMARTPALLSAYVTFCNVLERGRLLPRSRALVGLAVAGVVDCEACLGAEMRAARRIGLAEVSIARALDGAPGDGLDRRERAAVRFATVVERSSGDIARRDMERARRAGLERGEISEIVALTALRLASHAVRHGLATPRVRPP